jgi:hypothetical protein
MMSLSKPLCLTFALILVAAAGIWGQEDNYGKIDTIFAETYKIDANNWAINVSMFNDEEILAMSIPLTYSDEKNRLVADSTVFKGGVAEEFRVKYARVDTATQCVTIGLINDVGVSVPPIPPGKGRVATIFISSLDKKPIKALKIDTVTTPPGNDLRLVMPPTEGIVPAFIIMESSKIKEPKEAKEVKEVKEEPVKKAEEGKKGE